MPKKPSAKKPRTKKPLEEPVSEKESDAVQVLHLVNGKDVLCMIETTKSSVRSQVVQMIHPVLLEETDSGQILLSKYAKFSDGDKIPIRKSLVLSAYFPTPEIEKIYYNFVEEMESNAELGKMESAWLEQMEAMKFATDDELEDFREFVYGNKKSDRTLH